MKILLEQQKYIKNEIERLYFLKQSIEEGSILVQTDDAVLENGEEIGLGSFVHYDLLVDGKIQKGVVVSVSNQAVIKEDCYKKNKRFI